MLSFRIGTFLLLLVDNRYYYSFHRIVVIILTILMIIAGNILNITSYYERQLEGTETIINLGNVSHNKKEKEE